MGVAQQLAEAAPEIAGCDEAHVLLWDEGDAYLARAVSATRSPLGMGVPEATAMRSEDVARRCSHCRRRRWWRRRLTPLSRILPLTGLISGVVVPIIARTTLFGVLCVSSNGRGSAPDRTLRERLSGVASLAATALDSVALLEEVRHQALHDPATELANSRLFEDRVTQSLAIARRNGGCLAMLFVDLDRFKAVNDAHGTRLVTRLRAVAERLLLTVRDEAPSPGSEATSLD